MNTKLFIVCAVFVSLYMGCSVANAQKTFCNATVTIAPVYENEEICLVSVDPAVGKNKVMWEKTPDVGTGDFRIYKEASINQYSQIGTVPFTQPSFFIDYSSQPESHGDKYKITVIDTCGHESAQSAFHKTMNLTVAVNGATMGLNWDDYVDESGQFIPGKFYIYRGTATDNLSLYDSISASFHSYNDYNVFSSYYYMIGVKKPGGCNMSKSISDMTYSNKKQNFQNGIDEISNEYYLKIYPNPFDKSTTVNFENKKQNKYTITISDLTGKVTRLYKNITTDKLEIEKRDLKNGIYFIDITGDKIIRGKLIIE
ncbi:MAG: T9SS type A sorting domain-containing protein [Bacteroidia bacterium]|nr:T9SS type A sorting domain-containing protein [Bacteroidia bacterium]